MIKTKFKVWDIHSSCFLKEFADRGGNALLYTLPLEKAREKYKREQGDIPYPYSTLSHIFSCPDFFIPLQGTQICDSTGKEIFEGDIILNDDDLVKFVVTWSKEHACFYCKQLWNGREDNLDDFEEFEFIDTRNSFSLSLGKNGPCCLIIGNTFENPELLKCDYDGYGIKIWKK